MNDFLFKLQEKEKLKQKARPKKPKPTEEADQDTSLSNVWKLLEVESNNTGFLLTHHGYHFFLDETKDWMKRKDSQSWNNTEMMRAKCNEWLKNVK